MASPVAQNNLVLGALVRDHGHGHAVSDTPKCITLHDWYTTTMQRIHAFVHVQVCLDTEFGLGAKILDELKDEEFARKLGADPLRPSKDQRMRDYTPQLYVCQNHQKYGTTGNLEKLGLKAEYDASRRKLCKRKGEDSQQPWTGTMSTPWNTKLECGTLRALSMASKS